MKIKFSDEACKQLDQLDKAVRSRILSYMDKVAVLENPRSRGEALRWGWAGAWRYRVGDYRVICEILDEAITIYVFEIDHRRKIYAKNR